MGFTFAAKCCNAHLHKLISKLLNRRSMFAHLSPFSPLSFSQQVFQSFTCDDSFVRTTLFSPPLAASHSIRLLKTSQELRNCPRVSELKKMSFLSGWKVREVCQDGRSVSNNNNKTTKTKEQHQEQNNNNKTITTTTTTTTAAAAATIYHHHHHHHQQQQQQRQQQ